MSKNTVIKIFIVALIVAGIYALVSYNSSAPETSKNQEGVRDPKIAASENSQNGQKESNQKLSPAPDFSLKDYDANTVSLSDFRDRAIVVNSWAAWCPFCRNELKDFAVVQEEFKGEITVIAINRAESLEVSKRYTDELDVTDKLIFLLDPNDSFYKSIGGFSMPETIFVDENGFIREHKRGPISEEEFRAKIKSLISENN